MLYKVKIKDKNNRRPKKKALFKFFPFSNKQKKVLTWWIKDISPEADKDAIITDGAIRSGKTLITSLSFVLWAMDTFNQQNFGMAGKTIGTFKRNVWVLLKLMLLSRGYKIRRIPDTDSNGYRISRGDVTNYFYIFGGKDERSQDLVQGFTAAGFFFDEVTLMPKSFVNQAIGRCSVEGSKLWFNCNPSSPYHWFKLEWIDKLLEKNAFRLHFVLDDNPTLSEKRKEFYKRMFSGVFYRRYILGLWVIAEGIIYDMFSHEKHVIKTENRQYELCYIAIDYGTQNPTTFNLWGKHSNKWIKVKEYYYSGRDKGLQKTDEDYYKDLEAFASDYPVKSLIIDPSAASFIAVVKKNGRFHIQRARNDVLEGIRNVSSAIS